MESFTVSYAPSSSIYALCAARGENRSGPCLILGVPDAKAPRISDEVHRVAAALPESELYLGSDANLETMTRLGRQSRIIHIAAHGFFRQDNPLFSGIRLGDCYLSLFDLYQLRLPVELLTLSGCATGLNAIAAGDELLGLVRGLLCSGARSLLLSLWDVDDSSTVMLMETFYRELPKHDNYAQALQSAMMELREQYPHPYHWAPFALIGKVFQSAAAANQIAK
jgi:CHAT domain-containing protein